MSQVDLAREIISVYMKHGWKLKIALLRPETHAKFTSLEDEILEGSKVQEAEVDALWFSRPSGRRDAWELRLLAESQYALFEAFEEDESEEAREEVRREMEAKLRDYVKPDRPGH